MATVQQIRAGIKATLAAYYAGQGVSIQVYDIVPGAVVAPCVVIEPASGEYMQTLGAIDRTMHALAAHAMVKLGDRESAQNTLDQIISATGAMSIAAGIATDRTLGGVTEWATASGYRDYGTRRFADADYLMATVDITEALAL